MYVRRLGSIPLTFAGSSMLEAHVMAAALGPYQVAPGRVRLVVTTAHGTPLAFVTFASLGRTFGYLKEWIQFERKDHG